jgi:hypothetical protein
MRRIEMTTNDKTETEREEVAKFAQYCMGSCHGDWSPEAEGIYDEVMRDDAAFEHYREQLRRYKEARAKMDAKVASAQNERAGPWWK